MYTSATQEKKRCLANSGDFLVAEIQSKDGKAPQAACGGAFHRATHLPGSFMFQVHDRGWSCGRGRYIRMSVTFLIYSQGPCL